MYYFSVNVSTWCTVYPVNRLGIMVLLLSWAILKKVSPWGCDFVAGPDLWPPCWWEQEEKNILQWGSSECHINCLLLDKAL